MQGREPLYGLFRNVVALTHFILLKMESNAKCKYETLCHWIEPFTFSIDNAAAVGSKSSWFCLVSMQQTIFFCIFMFMTTDRIKKRDIRIFTKRRGGVNSNDYFASWPMNAGEIERWEWNICFENISAGGHRLFWYTHIAHLHLCTWQHTACPQKIPEYRQKMKSTFLSLSMIGPNASTPSLPHKASWLFAEKGNWLENMAAVVYKACVLGVGHCTKLCIIIWL